MEPAAEPVAAVILIAGVLPPDETIGELPVTEVIVPPPPPLPLAAAVILPCASTVIFVFVYEPADTEVSANLSAVTASSAIFAVETTPLSIVKVAPESLTVISPLSPSVIDGPCGP